MKSPNFGIPDRCGQGRATSIAACFDGTVVEVHLAVSDNFLYIRSGSVNFGLISFHKETKVAEGYNPTVVMNKDKQVILAYISPQRLLCYHVGKVQNNVVTLGKAHTVSASGLGMSQEVLGCSLAMNDSGVVIMTAQLGQEPLSSVLVHVGKIQDSDVAWSGPLRSLFPGASPSITLNKNNAAILTFRPPQSGSLHYMACSVTDQLQLKPGSPHEYTGGKCGRMVLSHDNVIVELHQAPKGKQIYYRRGRLQDGRIVWKPNKDYEVYKGRKPSLSLGGDVLVQTHTSADKKNVLHYSACLLVDRDRWMELSPSIQDKKLYEITFPGTHDSGTYEMSSKRTSKCTAPSILPGAITKLFAKVQERSIYDQLAGGVRFFDLRPAFQDGEFYTYHDCLGPKLEDQLDQVKRFLEKAKKEVVLLQFGNFCDIESDDDHKRLISLIKSKLGTFIYEGAFMTKTIKELTAKGPCVLIGYGDEWIKSHPHPGFPRSLNIFNKFSNTDDYGVMHSDQLSKLKANQGSSKKMFALAWQLTFTDFGSLKEGFSMKPICSKANEKLAEFVHQHGKEFAINILLVDFFEDARVLDIAMFLNRYRHK